MKRPILWMSVAALGLLWLLSVTTYVVSETEQALIIRLGAPAGVVSVPGLQFKLPFVDSVNLYDARQLLLEPPVEQVILGDQKRIEVQTYARYRIADPLRFYQSLRTPDQANAQLGQLVSSSLRKELGQVNLPALLSDERTRIVARIEAEVQQKANSLGVDVSEVRFRKADLPLETSQAIYERMKSERQREAKELRAQGAEWAQQIQSKADKEKSAILSEAQRTAKISRGQADAHTDHADTSCKRRHICSKAHGVMLPVVIGLRAIGTRQIGFVGYAIQIVQTLLVAL